MVTKISTKGQVVLPGAIRRRLGLQAGDPLDVKMEGERIVLTPQKKRSKRKARIVKDPVTGFPVLTLGPGAPILTSKEVEEMLAEFQ
ncbi:MAG: AbrB/MazE/SpoVT family DNA-binding domain-containing protein [Candidatus Korobacteraceae bacterium]